MNFKKSAYRPSLHGNVQTMLHVRSCGHYIINQEWHDRKIQKSFLELFWCIRGKGKFCCNEKQWKLNAEEVCFYLPNDYHQITQETTPFEYYWLTIDGPELPSLIRMFDINRPPRNAGKCPVPTFERLIAELHDRSSFGEFRAGATAYEILSLAFAGTSSQFNPIVRKFSLFIENGFTNGDLSIESFAQEHRIHRSTLTRLIKQHCGMSPMEYLNSFRMQEALHLLYDTEYTVKEIAECCGFNNPNYFSKVILHRFGKVPTELRKSQFTTNQKTIS